MTKNSILFVREFLFFKVLINELTWHHDNDCNVWQFLPFPQDRGPSSSWTVDDMVSAEHMESTIVEVVNGIEKSERDEEYHGLRFYISYTRSNKFVFRLGSRLIGRMPHWYCTSFLVIRDERPHKHYWISRHTYIVSCYIYLETTIGQTKWPFDASALR